MTGMEVMLATALVGSALSMKQAGDQRKLSSKLARNKATLERQQLDMQKKSADRKRDAEEKRTLATQRARTGAAGLDSRDGSSAAIVRGMQRQYDEDRAEASKNFIFGQNSIQNSLAESNARSLLQSRHSMQNAAFSAAKAGASYGGSLLDEKANKST